jgi:sodium/bile acid cotransporter 7
MPTVLKKHAFTLWLFLAVVLAVFLPEPGSKGGMLHPELTTKLGVWVIFFLQGLSLPTSELAAGYKPKRLHVFVLAWNFLLFPLVSGLLLLPLSLMLGPELRLGFWLLAILPTTVISATTFTALAGGQTSNAIFSTVFSNVLSVLVVPAVAVIYLSTETATPIPILPLFSNLALLIVLPLVIGQMLRKLAWEQAAHATKKAKHVSHVIIVFIVYAAFAQSVSSGFLEVLSLQSLLGVLISTVAVLLTVSTLVWFSSAALQLTRSQRIAAFFCASQKSLATGLPLASSILLAAPGLVDPAMVLIPLLCYHPLQLVLAGWLAGQFGRRN